MAGLEGKTLGTILRTGNGVDVCKSSNTSALQMEMLVHSTDIVITYIRFLRGLAVGFEVAG
jgi:hypothetical protein